MQSEIRDEDDAALPQR